MHGQQNIKTIGYIQNFSFSLCVSNFCYQVSFSCSIFYALLLYREDISSLIIHINYNTLEVH